MPHSATKMYLHTKFRIPMSNNIRDMLFQIINKICYGHNYSRTEARGQSIIGKTNSSVVASCDFCRLLINFAKFGSRSEC